MIHFEGFAIHQGADANEVIPVIEKGIGRGVQFEDVGQDDHGGVPCRGRIARFDKFNLCPNHLTVNPLSYIILDYFWD